MNAKHVILTHFSQRYPRISEEVLKLVEASTSILGPARDCPEGEKIQTHIDDMNHILEIKEEEISTLNIPNNVIMKVENSDRNNVAVKNVSSTRGNQLEIEHENNFDNEIDINAEIELHPHNLSQGFTSSSVKPTSLTRGSIYPTKQSTSHILQISRRRAAPQPFYIPSTKLNDHIQNNNQNKSLDVDLFDNTPLNEILRGSATRVGVAFDLMSVTFGEMDRLQWMIPALGYLYPSKGKAVDMEEGDELDEVVLSGTSNHTPGHDNKKGGRGGGVKRARGKRHR